MAISANELPTETKRLLLHKLQDDLGTTEYKRLVDELGEEGLLNLVLQSIAAQSPVRLRGLFALRKYCSNVYGFFETCCLFITLPLLEYPVWRFIIQTCGNMWIDKHWQNPFLFGLFLVLCHAVAFRAIGRDRKPEPDGCWQAIGYLLILLYYPAMMLTGLVFVIRGLVLALS